MEQLNSVLPVIKEEIQPVEEDIKDSEMNFPLLNQVRLKFGIFGGISLFFGVIFAICFYKAGIGLNYFIFALVMVFLLNLMMNKLSLPIKKATKAYYLGTVLLGLSTMLTASQILQFLNVIAMLLLLELSLIHQFHDDRWDFAKQLGRMFGLLFSCIASIGRPFVDSFTFFKKTRLFKTDRARSILLGIVIALPLLLVIVALLSSADLLFGEITQKVYKFMFSPNIINVGLIVLFGFVACYSIICGAVWKSEMKEKRSTMMKADPAIAVTVMSLICIVYALFCGIQVIYLFADGLFVLPVEFTFAEYARRGFFELLTVTIINIILMLICKTTFRESKILRIILTCITLCTYIMIVSATYRMLFYIGAYHLTFLRLFVLLFLLIDALVLTGVIISEYNKKFHLFGYCVAVISICYLVFSFARPDYFIADYHIKQTLELDEGDFIFLTKELSMDAAPMVIPLLSGKKEWAGRMIKEEDYERYISSDGIDYSINNYYNEIAIQQQKMRIRDFNYSYYMANRYVERYPSK